MHTAHILGGYYFRQHSQREPSPLPSVAAVVDMVDAAAAANLQAFRAAATEDPGFVNGDESQWALRVSEPLGAALFDLVLANNTTPDDEQIRMVLDWVLVQAGYSPGAVA